MLRFDAPDRKPPDHGAPVPDGDPASGEECFCLGLDPQALRAAIDVQADAPGLSELIRRRCPHLFSPWALVLSQRVAARMAQVVRGIEHVASLPAYREAVLGRAPAIARASVAGARPHGVFMGYDFHANEARLGLIEINTNAGGAMLNAMLARAQRACCPAVAGAVPDEAAVGAWERRIVAMFRREWRRAARGGPLETIAIVDDGPQEQYLYPEFLLFRGLFERYRIRCIVCDPAELAFRAGALWRDDVRIDLVYNRLTDFYLDAARHAALREAFERDAVVLTPHPRVHALFADKRNLAILGDAQGLRDLGADPELACSVAAAIPRTHIVDAGNAESFWRERRRWFFKPFAGFGSRAAYRGDKLTRRVWGEIAGGGYVAQELVAPGERIARAAGSEQALKFDLRNYAYHGKVQWLAARLYRGQTMNFRTPDGGFAPVYRIPQAAQDSR